MSDLPQDIVAQYRAQLDQDAWLENKHASYEARMVKRVLTHFKLQEKEANLLRRCEELTGVRDLSFDWLLQEHPSFPVRLGARSLPYIYEINIEQLYKRFTKTKIYTAYLDLLETAPTDEVQANGLVFHWPAIGDMVLHNHPRIESGGLRMSFTVGRSRQLFLDLLTDNQRSVGFLYGVSQIWSP